MTKHTAIKRLKTSSIILLFVLFLTHPQPAKAGYDDFTINVPNAQGSYTAIVMKRSGSGFIGPQGEYYAQFPTVAQLQAMYNLGTPPATIPAPPEPAVNDVSQSEQPQVTYQVVPQAPYQDEEDDDYYAPVPVMQPNYIAIENRNYSNQNNWSFFEFKKKKKPQQNQPNQPGQQNQQHQQNQQGQHGQWNQGNNNQNNQH